eukprot:GFUD01020260.1.p1 GENE.GFUD01020260.1~~GFUD01020260.1.p1  ORF type:complete len:363 (+),score=128.56 GFUD01020260.1:166-1254(+)
MSILEFNKEDNVAIVSHKKFLEEVYNNASMFWGTLDIFDINTPFRMDLEAENVAKSMEIGHQVGSQKKKKRRLEAEKSIQQEISYLKEKFHIFQSMKPAHFSEGPTVENVRQNNKTLRQNVKLLLTTLHTINIPDKGENKTMECVEQDGLLFPPQSEFRKLDVNNLAVLGNSAYDLILMDPPWSNKHVKRVKRTGGGYEMMDNRDLEEMPVDRLLQDGGLVFVWCTNKVTHRAAVTAWFVRWGVTMVGTWYWVKVTQHGEMVSQFSQDKQPYEVVIIGEKCRPGIGNVGLKDVRDGLVIFSVPSGIHSHKPPLSHLMQAVVGDQMDRSWHMLDKLEMFGRYLLPGWLTVGNQPCLLNSSVKV